MKETPDRDRNVEYLGTVLLFIVGGGLIGSAAYVSFIPATARTALKVGLVATSLAAWFVLSRSEHLRQYRQIALSFFAVSPGVLLAHYCGSIPMDLLWWRRRHSRCCGDGSCKSRTASGVRY